MTAEFTITFCRIVIALAFALSAGGKALDMPSFQVAIKDFQLLPARWSKIAAYCLAGLEAIVVLLLLGERSLVIGFGLAIGLLILFTVALVITIRRKKAVTCNCFGRTERRVSNYDVGRNVVLIAIALTGVRLSLDFSRDLATSEVILSGLLASTVVILVINLADIVRTLLRPFQTD